MAHNQIHWNRYDTVYCQKSSHSKELCKAWETASHNICCQISLQENLPTSHAVDEQKWRIEFNWMGLGCAKGQTGPTHDELESYTW